MLKELKFVQGAVAKKDLIPAMTHFRIENGFVRSYNGMMALCSPIDCDLDCIPLASQMVDAIGKCDETPVLSMARNGSLRIVSGPVKFYVDCVDGETAHVEPKGQEVFFDGEVLLAALKMLFPFTGEDASRPWTNGILLQKQSAFATNNVIVVEYWLGTDVPFVVNLPKEAVREMLRIDEPPTHAQIDTNSLTLHYTDGRWIRTQLLETSWPDLTKILDHPSDPIEIDERLFEGMKKLERAADELGRIYLLGDIMRTHLSPDDEDPNDVEKGAEYNCAGMGIRGIYQMKMLKLLEGVATHADFSRYPNPTLFFGERLRGAIAGMRP